MRRGFTLVELLVVIGILSMLTAILFPVLAHAREASRKAACGSNLRQIGHAFALYVSDYDEYFPCTGDPMLWMGRRWRWPLQPYLAFSARRSVTDPGNPNVSQGYQAGILVCPSDTTAAAAWDSTSYAYAACFYHTSAQVNAMSTTDLLGPTAFPCVAQSVAAVKHPARKALAGEWLTNHSRVAQGWWTWGGNRHYVFVDGHAKYLDTTLLRPAVNGQPDINLTRDGLAGYDVE